LLSFIAAAYARRAPGSNGGDLRFAPSFSDALLALALFPP
jgi:hypothetical protein